MNKEILSYDVNEIHKACESIGHTTGWEYFKEELKTYSKEDKIRLIKELKELFGEVEE